MKQATWGDNEFLTLEQAEAELVSPLSELVWCFQQILWSRTNKAVNYILVLGLMLPSSSAWFAAAVALKLPIHIFPSMDLPNWLIDFQNFMAIHFWFSLLYSVHWPTMCPLQNHSGRHFLIWGCLNLKLKKENSASDRLKLHAFPFLTLSYFLHSFPPQNYQTTQINFSPYFEFTIFWNMYVVLKFSWDLGIWAATCV